MTAAEARHRLACYLASGWTSSEGYARIPERGEAHPEEETDDAATR